jgi:hypothetical protein
VDVEVVYTPLDYKLLLGFNWTYPMTVVISSVFHTLFFPHDGKILTIDHFPFAYASPSASIGPLILMVDNSQLKTKNIKFIHPLWVPLTSLHRFTMFMPCPIGSFHQIGLFLSALPILTILGPYLP